MRHALLRASLMGTFSIVLSGGLGRCQIPPNSELPSRIVAGTITIVIATPEGFVLAADSRVTETGIDAQGQKVVHYEDNAQKLFKIGAQTACVIAGLSGSQVPGHGDFRVFRVEDAIASNLVLLDQRATAEHRSPDAREVEMMFLGSFRGVADLLPWLDGVEDGQQLGGLDVVSFTDKAVPQWLSIKIAADISTAIDGTQIVRTGDPVIERRKEGNPLTFDFWPLGQPMIANEMLNATRPVSGNGFSRYKIMLRYYRLKRDGKLNDLTLRDAVRIAELVIKATEQLAPTESGVGGPIDIATLTAARGVTWIRKKSNSAPVPPPFHVRFTMSALPVAEPPRDFALDGVQCIRCRIANGSLFTYHGNADVELIDPIFEGAGRCSVLLFENANHKQPQAVERLISALGRRCSFSGDLPVPYPRR
jgi:hypothetical protein